MADEKEKQAFYKTNAKILKLDTKKDRDLILFNQYIEKKENFQRINGELEKGLFELSYSNIEKEMEYSRRKARKVMKYFEDNKIIECIEKSTKKGVPSIYAYTSVYYSNSEPNYEPNSEPNYEPNLSSVSNGLEYIAEPNSEPNSEPFKKELLKRDIKNNNMSDSKESDAPPGAFKGDNNNSNKTNEYTITTKSKREKEKEKNSTKKKEKDQQIKEVVEYLNLKANRKYKPETAETKKLISARLKDYTVEDLKAVIDFKVAEWLENEKMNKFLRPSTLFRESNFENYFNELPSEKEVEKKESPPISEEEFYNL